MSGGRGSERLTQTQDRFDAVQQRSAIVRNIIRHDGEDYDDGSQAFHGTIDQHTDINARLRRWLTHRLLPWEGIVSEHLI